MRRSLCGFEREGVLPCLRVGETIIERQSLSINRKNEHGPFDIIGDVHGCFDELSDLLGRLGYILNASAGEYAVQAPEGRRLIFAGDLVDRGPGIPHVLKLVSGLVQSGQALCVPGNHDVRLARALRGEKLALTYGLGESLEQIAAEPEEFKTAMATFIDSLVSHYVLDDGNLVVAHAGLKEEMHGRVSDKVRDVAVHGEKTGARDQFGEIRREWAADYRGNALVVYGHTPVAEPLWLNNTVNIDTGCIFGGSLTALRYPEREIVSIQARRMYFQATRPFLPGDSRLESFQ